MLTEKEKTWLQRMCATCAHLDRDTEKPRPVIGYCRIQPVVAARMDFDGATCPRWASIEEEMFACVRELYEHLRDEGSAG